MCADPIRHGRIDYTVVALDACLDLVTGLQAAKRKWHSHVLSPGCAFNPYPDLYAIVVEDDSESIAYIAPSEGFPDIDKTFVKMLHGDDILDETTSRRGSSDMVENSALLARVVEIDRQGIAWHHHMNFPDCVLNPHRGRWAITVESGAGTFSESYDEEPTDLLREIEILYFRNLAQAGQDPVETPV